MGVVKYDVSKHEHQYKQISLSDPMAIKALIKFRSIIDENYDFEPEELKEIQEISKQIAKHEAKRHGKTLIIRNTTENKYSASDIRGVNQELIALYADLDRLIEMISFSEKQRSILNMLMCGLDEEDIAFYYGQRKWKIKKIINTICKKIKNQNDILFYKTLEQQGKYKTIPKH